MPLDMISSKSYWSLVGKSKRSALEEAKMDAYQRYYKRKRVRIIQRRFVKAVLPEARVGSVWAMGNPHSLHTFARLEGIGGQKALRNSSYDYPLSRTSRLVHYTGHEQLGLILREGAFRAFSLSHSSDDKEFITKASEMGCADWNLKKWRDNLFSLSFVDLTRNGESERHWKEYGRSGRGVGIVVSIDPAHRYQWVDYFIGPIFYDGEHETRYARLREEIATFEKEHVFRWDRPEDLYAKLFAFHKVSDFEWENEVRLLAHWPHKSGTGGKGMYTERQDLIEHLNSRFDRSYSVPLYLGTKLDAHLCRPDDPELQEAIKHLGPKLRIEEIIVGPEVTSREFSELFEYSNEIAIRTIGYRIPMRWSELRRSNRTGTFG